VRRTRGSEVVQHGRCEKVKIKKKNKKNVRTAGGRNIIRVHVGNSKWRAIVGCSASEIFWQQIYIQIL